MSRRLSGPIPRSSSPSWPAVMADVPARPGEEAWYGRLESLLDVAAVDANQDLDEHGERLDGLRSYAVTFPARWLAAGPRLVVADAVQRAPLRPSRRAEPLLVRHQGQEPAPCGRRVADPGRLGPPPPADQELRAYWPEQPILDGARTPPIAGKARPGGSGTWSPATAGGTVQMSCSSRARNATVG